MKVPKDVICGVCKKVFCCAECRYKHEIKIHAIIIKKPMTTNQSNEDLKANNFGDQTNHIYLFCPLCERKPMPLQREMYAEMLAHVEQNHLPLRCRKCAKVYSRLDDLQNFTNCTQTTSAPTCYCLDKGCFNQLDHNCDTVTLQKDFARVTISTQTSPQRRQCEEFHQTPMSLINIRWKAKSKLTHEEFICDSVSSLKNISSISNSSLRRSLDAMVKPKGQLVRTTSTPVHAELLCTKHTERTFNASGAQVSSIYHSGGETDNHSPAIAVGAVTTSNPATLSPSKQQLENLNRYLKVGGPRGKMSAVTPLRQVMSKSIQKAFAEHGGLPSARISGVDLPSMRKKMFDSQTADSSSSSTGSPLDLRLSPVVRRTHSEIQASQLQANGASTERISTVSQNLHQEVFRSSQKLTTTESIVITRTKHLAGVESAASSMSSSTGSVAFKTADKLATSSTSTRENCSGVSSASSSSVYKSCESIEIITATTALSEIQQGYYTVSDRSDNAEKIIPTMESVTQVVSYNLPPITPITRIPGSLINKKMIRFDSPCEEDDKGEESEGVKNHHKGKENSENTTTKSNTPCKIKDINTSPKRDNNNTANAGPKAIMKVNETPRSTDSSICEAFFTPNATPVRRSKKPPTQENACASNDFSKLKLRRIPSLSKPGRSTAFDRSESITDNENEHYGEEHSLNTKHQSNRNNTTALGRSWSFSALLGSVMRLNSTEKVATPETKRTSPHTDVNSNSIVKRCASMAGSLMRTQSLIEADEQKSNQKRKRSYTTDMTSVQGIHYPRHYSDPVSPSPEKLLCTKRFRIHGRKPIERMRREL